MSFIGFILITTTFKWMENVGCQFQRGQIFQRKLLTLKVLEMLFKLFFTNAIKVVTQGFLENLEECPMNGILTVHSVSLSSSWLSIPIDQILIRQNTEHLKLKKKNNNRRISVLILPKRLGYAVTHNPNLHFWLAVSKIL